MRSRIEYPGSSEVDTKGNTAEEVARMAFAFIAASKAFSEGMDKSDEVKLLRLRTRKNEIVIVPGKFTISQPEPFVCFADMQCRQIINFSSLSSTIHRQPKRNLLLCLPPCTMSFKDYRGIPQAWRLASETL